MDLVIILSRKADETDIKIKSTFPFTISKNRFWLPLKEEKSLQNPFIFKYLKGGNKSFFFKGKVTRGKNILAQVEGAGKETPHV